MRYLLDNRGWCETSGRAIEFGRLISRVVSGLIVGGALAVAGCSSGSLEPADTPAGRTDVDDRKDTVARPVEFFPLSVGNWWSLSQRTRRFTIRVVDSLGQGGHHRYVVVYDWGVAAYDKDSLYLRADSAGRVFSFSKDGSGSPSLYLDPGAPTGSDMLGQLVSNQATVTTTAGTFEKCVVVQRNELVDDLDAYAPHVGPVAKTLGRSSFRLDSALVGGRRY